MVWVIVLTLLSISFSIICKENAEGGMLGIIFCLSILAFIIVGGINAYPSLRAEREEIISLKEEIDTIRAAHYSSVGNGEFVGGSLDNMQQSTILSKYPHISLRPLSILRVQDVICQSIHL